MTSTNSSNDRLLWVILHQNVEINSNWYLTTYFREWNRPPRGMETPLRNHQKNVRVQRYFKYQWYKIFNGLSNDHRYISSLIICDGLWCQLPFFYKLSVITEALFRCDASDVSWLPGCKQTSRDGYYDLGTTSAFSYRLNRLYNTAGDKRWCPYHRFSQKWQLRVCKWNFRGCKRPLLNKIPMKMKELG